MPITGHELKIQEAIEFFWKKRGEDGVRNGKTMDKFVEVLLWVVQSNGLPDAKIVTGRIANVPGYFRPVKSWDVLIFSSNRLIAAIELKSIADSFGNNANNRTEEVLGSGIDLKEAIAENAFENVTSIFTGYFLLIEDCPGTNEPVSVKMPEFRVMNEFIDESQRLELYNRNENGEFPSILSVSYRRRFDILCKRLMQKKLYTAAAVTLSKRDSKLADEYTNLSPETSIKTFLSNLAGFTAGIQMQMQ